MSGEPKYFDPKARLAEKAAARAQDDADLASGKRTAAEIQAANSFAGDLDLANAKIGVPNPEAWDVPERFHVEPEGPTLHLRGGEDAPKAPLVVEQNGTWYRRVGLLTLWAYFNEPDATTNEDPPVVRAEIMEDLARLGGTYGCTLLDGVMHFAFPSEARLREFEARWLKDEF